jgi:hypothetical protein
VAAPLASPQTLTNPAPNDHIAINCASSAAMCTEVGHSDDVFGHYVGHDEPSVLFYSNKPGSGNRMTYYVTLPKEPPADNPLEPGKSYQFELSGADWFGMAICDTQSYPEQVSKCPPDSDKNILEPTASPDHVGQAYMEMQFYPPGWVPWPTWALAVGASGCDPTMWCAALNIDSLSLNPVTGQTNNSACLAKAGEEYVNFAFITKSGQSQAPANPVQSTLATYTPNPSQDLYMAQGDHLRVNFQDTPDGLKVTIDDLTSGQSGSMTASAANGFAQVKFAPNGHQCQAIPYNFHPMYSTSTPRTRVTWAAHSYNVAYDTEIGHFQFCTGPYQIPATPFGYDRNGNPTVCPGSDVEEEPPTTEPADFDDIFCFPAREAMLYRVPGCTYTNLGFDGASYQPLWPDGNPALHPTPLYFTSPKTGWNFGSDYQQVAFEADTPAIEAEQPCNDETGSGCTRLPKTDDGQVVTFYPFYTDSNAAGGCVWEFGNNIPGEITNFGQDAQYGKIISLSYTVPGGGSQNFYEDYRNILNNNPCPQGSGT